MKTDETTATDTTIEAAMPQGPLLTPVNRTLMLGNNPAIAHSATITRNHNGKLNVELDLTIGNRRMQHNLYLSTPGSAANTAKQLKNAFGVDLEAGKANGTIRAELAKVNETPCSVRIENEEYNGRISPRIKYVNPQHTEAVGEDELADIEFAAPSNVDEVAF